MELQSRVGIAHNLLKKFTGKVDSNTIELQK